MTVPSGGTSDYAPEMIHAAAQRRALRLLRAARHADSVHGDARRCEALLALAAAPRERLTRTAYNLAAFNPSAEEISGRGAARVPSGADQLADRHQAAGHRRFVAGSRRRLGGARATGDLRRNTISRPRFTIT